MWKVTINTHEYYFEHYEMAYPFAAYWTARLKFEPKNPVLQ